MPKLNLAVVGAGGVGAETIKQLKKNSHPIRIIDRDFVDTDTLKRQTLYRKADLGKLKASIAAQKFGNGCIGICEHLFESNADELLQNVDVVLDCTDNWTTRAVINQWALNKQKPWIFTSAIRSQTMSTTVAPDTPCFVCWNPKPATPRSCRLEGISKQTTAIAAQTQVQELNELLKKMPTLAGILQLTDTQNKTCITQPLKKNPKCSACVKKTFRIPHETGHVLCGNKEFLFDLKTTITINALRSLKPKKIGDIIQIQWKQGQLNVFNGKMLTRNLEKSEAQKAAEAIRQKTNS